MKKRVFIVILTFILAISACVLKPKTWEKEDVQIQWEVSVSLIDKGSIIPRDAAEILQKDFGKTISAEIPFGNEEAKIAFKELFGDTKVYYEESADGGRNVLYNEDHFLMIDRNGIILALEESNNIQFLLNDEKLTAAFSLLNLSERQLSALSIACFSGIDSSKADKPLASAEDAVKLAEEILNEKDKVPTYETIEVKYNETADMYIVNAGPNQIYLGLRAKDATICFASY